MLFVIISSLFGPSRSLMVDTYFLDKKLPSQSLSSHSPPIKLHYTTQWI